MGMEIKRFSVVLVILDPTVGREIKKTRPCLVISPDEMNDWISTVIVAPMTSKGRDYPSRVNCSFEGISGQVVLDQIRSIDKKRIIKNLGRIDKRTESKVLNVLADLFAP